MTKLIQNCFDELEKTAINLLCARLGKISEADTDDLENLIKLQNAGEDLQMIKKEISEIIDKAKLEIYNIIEDYAQEYYDEAASVMTAK